MRILIILLVVYAGLVSSASASPCYEFHDDGSSFFCGAGTVYLFPTPVHVNDVVTFSANVSIYSGATSIDTFSFNIGGYGYVPLSFEKITPFDFVQTGYFGLAQNGVSLYARFSDSFGFSGCAGAADSAGCSSILFDVLPAAVTAVPEPGTWLMFIIGLALVSTFHRSKISPLGVEY